MKKRVIGLLLTSMFAISIVAGYGKEVAAEATTSIYDVENRTYEDVEIDVYTKIGSGTAWGDWYDAYVTSFMEQYPGITVNRVDIPTESEYNDARAIAMSDTNSMPNIFIGFGGTSVLAYIESGNVIETSGYFEYDDEWASGFNDTGWDAVDFSSFGYEGIYGVPWSTYQVLMYYNEEILTENGISAENIKSWDDLMDACATLMENGVQPFSIGEKDDYRFGHLYSSIGYKMYGCSIADQLANDELTYDGEEIVQILTVMKDMIDKGYLGTNLLGTDGGQETELFLNGDTAFYFMGSWFCAELENYADNPYFANESVHAMRVPYVNSEYEYSEMGSNNDTFYVVDTGNEDEIAASMLFLKHLTSVEETNKLLAVYGNPFAINTTIEVDNYLLKEVMAIMAETKEAKTEIELYDTASHMMNTVRSALQGLAMDQTPEQVAQQIVDTAEQYE